MEFIRRARLAAEVGEGKCAIGKGNLQLIARKKNKGENQYCNFESFSLGAGDGISAPVNLNLFYPTASPSYIYYTGSKDIEDLTGLSILLTGGKVVQGETTQGLTLIFLGVSSDFIKNQTQALVSSVENVRQKNTIEEIFKSCKAICILQSNTYSPTTLIGSGGTMLIGNLDYTVKRKEPAPKLNITHWRQLFNDKKFKQFAVLLKKAAGDLVYLRKQELKRTVKAMLEFLKKFRTSDDPRKETYS